MEETKPGLAKPELETATQVRYLIPKVYDTDLIFGDPWGNNSGLRAAGFSLTYKSTFFETWEKPLDDDPDKRRAKLSFDARTRTLVHLIGQPHPAHSTMTSFNVRLVAENGDEIPWDTKTDAFVEKCLGDLFILAETHTQSHLLPV